MRRPLTLAGAILVLLFTAPLLFAQGTLEVSNLSHSQTGNGAIGSDTWIAQSIITGNNAAGYTLNSVELLMNSASGNPSGFTVSVYSSANVSPANDLGNLTGSDPLTSGTYTYSTSGISLSPSTGYFIVVTDANPVAQGAYNWIATSDETVGTENWTIVDSYFSSANGSTWTGHNRSSVFEMALFATPVPEPSTYTLGVLGAMVLGCHRWRNSSR